MKKDIRSVIFKVLVYFLFFFIGMEYVLVLPSLNGHLKRKVATKPSNRFVSL